MHSNIKLIDLRERTNLFRLFALLKSSAGLFGSFNPLAARQAPAVFFIVSNTTKILHFYLERAVCWPASFRQFCSLIHITR